MDVHGKDEQGKKLAYKTFTGTVSGLEGPSPSLTMWSSASEEIKIYETGHLVVLFAEVRMALPIKIKYVYLPIQDCIEDMWKLLLSVPEILNLATGLSLSVKNVKYTRGTFIFTGCQSFPHRNFSKEILYLENYFGKLASGGRAYVMGDSEKNYNWHVYTASAIDVPTDDPVIRDILPGSKICDFEFDPYGYSMNAIEGDVVSTIHVTPEDGFSYASFESMGYGPEDIELKELVERVLLCFKPKPFKESSTLFCTYQSIFTFQTNRAYFSEFEGVSFYLPITLVGEYENRSWIEENICLLLDNKIKDTTVNVDVTDIEKTAVAVQLQCMLFSSVRIRYGSIVGVHECFGYKKPAIEDPVKTNKIPRQIPKQP
ncbi:hypothetical protein KI387_032480, partial [Taxus chinensis]